MQLFHLLAWLSTFADLVAGGLAILRLRAGRNAGSSRLLADGRVVVILLALFWFVKLVVLRSLGLDLFGVIRVVYLEAVVVAPILGLTWLYTDRRRASLTLPSSPLPLRWLAGSACLLAPVGIYTSWIEPFRLQLETATVTVAAERDGATPLRVGVLSDIQTEEVTRYESDAVDRLMAQRPDLILLPGDLWQGRPRPFDSALPALRGLLERLHAPGGVYFVLGDVDHREEIERLVAGTAVTLLVDESRQVQVGDRRITIGGTQRWETAPAAQRFMKALEADPDPGDIRILVSHHPDAVLHLSPRTRVDLVVAGHTHGGQVVLPFFGPLMTLSAVPRAVAAGGLHEVGEGRRIYVSRGVGHEHGQAPRIRFLCPPEISVIEVTGR